MWEDQNQCFLKEACCNSVLTYLMSQEQRHKRRKYLIGLLFVAKSCAVFVLAQVTALQTTQSDWRRKLQCSLRKGFFFLLLLSCTKIRFRMRRTFDKFGLKCIYYDKIHVFTHMHNFVIASCTLLHLQQRNKLALASNFPAAISEWRVHELRCEALKTVRPLRTVKVKTKHRADRHSLQFNLNEYLSF